MSLVKDYEELQLVIDEGDEVEMVDAKSEVEQAIFSKNLVHHTGVRHCHQPGAGA